MLRQAQTVEPSARDSHIDAMLARPNQPQRTALPKSAMRKLESPLRPLTNSAAEADERAEAKKGMGATNQGVGEPREIGGPRGPEPTRYGDWEVNGRCSDF